MAFGVYKPGQGYWVRVLTAVVAGVLVLAAGAWAWEQTATLETAIPTTRWDVQVTGTTGTVDAGQTVTLFGTDPEKGEVELGTALVSRFDGDTLVLTDADLAADSDVPDARRITVQAPGAAEPSFAAAVGDRVLGIKALDPIFLQAAAMALVVLIGAFIIYWFVAHARRSSEFLIATDTEMKKVNWSTRREVVGSTFVVVAACFLIAAVLFVIDFAFQFFFRMVNVLEA